MFIGRDNEQKIINSLLTSDRFECALIYGRRRIGKTELVKHCIYNSNSKTIFYQCKESTEKDNVGYLTRSIEQCFNLSHLHFDSFFDALEFIFEQSKMKSICLVIDEYPYIRELIKGCDSKLQDLIDRYHNSSKIKFFLIGSSISIMEGLLANSSPLYGRFNRTIKLSQMDYFDSAKFYPSFSNEDKIKLYSVFGGVPLFNARIDEKISANENIIRLIEGSFIDLAAYVEVYLKSELRKMNSANIIFEAIAHGAFHFSDICGKCQKETKTNLNVILRKLIEMDFIEYIHPINDPNNKKKSGYRIKDHIVKFYYRYIYSNDLAMPLLTEEAFFERCIKEDLECAYIPLVFEKVCKEYLIRKNRELALEPPLEDIGTYWYDNPIEKRNGQFDVVGKTKDGYIFYECKYTNTPITDKIIEKEISQVNETTLHPAKYGFFSKSGFKIHKKKDCILIDLKDLFKSK